MLKVPYSSSWKASPRTIVMWFYVSKYPLQALLHILSVCTGEYYLQVWACACSGDIIIRWVWGHHYQVGLGTLSSGGSGDIIIRWVWGHYHQVGLGTSLSGGSWDIIIRWIWGHYHQVGLGTLLSGGSGDIIIRWVWGHHYQVGLGTWFGYQE